VLVPLGKGGLLMAQGQERSLQPTGTGLIRKVQ